MVRWDKPEPEVFTPSSIASQMVQFYRYLTHDRVQSTQRVTDHMLKTFRRVRSLVAEARIPDDHSIEAYLAFLARAINRSNSRNEADPFYGADEDLLGSLAPAGVDALLEDLTSRSSSEMRLALVPSLAVRHAGSEIFQEAHYELRRTSTHLDLFGYIGPAKGKRVTRGSTHFTPPALARIVAEQALAQIPDLTERERLTILDPACGSGVLSVRGDAGAWKRRLSRPTRLGRPRHVPTRRVDGKVRAPGRESGLVSGGRVRHRHSEGRFPGGRAPAGGCRF